MLSYLGLSDYLIAVLFLNLIMGAVLLVSIRWLMGLVTSVNSVEELAHRDNPAFGITMSGAVLGVGIIGSGIISGDPAATLGRELVILLGYGAAALVAILVSRRIFDRISLPHLEVREELRKGNIAVALTDAGNALATALIVRGVINWVSGSDLSVAVIACLGFAASQIALSLVSAYRIRTYNQAHDSSFQTALGQGNAALAVRFAGFQIGAAFGLTSALNLVPYDPANAFYTFATWVLVAAVILPIQFLLAGLAGRALLGSVDMREEVDRQGNVAVGAVQASTLIAIGLALLALTA